MIHPDHRRRNELDPEVQEKRGFFSKIPGKLRWLIVALVFNNVAIGYLLVYLTAFFPELGISAGVVGLLLGLEGAMVLLSIPLGILSDRTQLHHHTSRPTCVNGTGLSHNADLAVSYPQGLQRNTEPEKTDKRQEFPDSPQVFRDQQPHRTRSRVHYSPDSDLAFPQVRNPRHVQRTPTLVVQPDDSARCCSKS